MMTFSKAIEQSRDDVAEAGETEAELYERDYIISKMGSLVKQGQLYTTDIEGELEKGEMSALEVDVERSENVSLTYITTRSLDRWAWDKYSIEILDGIERIPPSDNTGGGEALSEDGAATGQALTKVKSENLYTTLELLINEIAKTAERYGGENPNVSTIAEHINELAMNANRNKTLAGQSKEAIKSRIEEALKTLKAKLPDR